MNLVRSNRRDLLAARLKEFEKEDLAVQQKEMVRGREGDIAACFIDLAYEYFRASKDRLATMSTEELTALNELIQQKSPRYLWIDILRRKVAPAVCLAGAAAGVYLMKLFLSMEASELVFSYFFFSLLGTIASLIVGGIFFGQCPSLWKKYHDNVRFLKKAKGDDYFPIEALCERLGIETAEPKPENAHHELQSP